MKWVPYPVVYDDNKKKKRETVHEAASQSKQHCDPLLGLEPAVEKRWSRLQMWFIAKLGSTKIQ